MKEQGAIMLGHNDRNVVDPLGADTPRYTKVYTFYT